MSGKETSAEKRQVDIEEIMAAVRAGLISRKGVSEDRLLGEDEAARAGPARTFGEEVYRGLHQAKVISGGLQVDYKVGYRTPILGQMWAVVRRRIHQEIRIYIDALARQQTSFNGHVIRALSRVVEGIDRRAADEQAARQAQQAAIEELRGEVALLSERVRELEAARARSEGTT